MVKKLHFIPKFLVFGIPIGLILSLVLLTRLEVYKMHPETLSTGITIDLLVTVPLLYFLGIRKSKIPKLTVVSLFILGVIVASLIIPKENQSLLTIVKMWVLPLVEIGIIGFVLFKVRQVLNAYRKNSNSNIDFFQTLKITTQEILPKKIAILLTMEIAVFYYGFVCWRKKELRSTEFTYHKNSTTVSLLIALICIIGMETYVLHVLLMKWSTTAAWVVSGVSIYSGIQIFGFLKSITKRPIVVEEDKVYLRYGIMSETIIDLRAIESVEVSAAEIEFNKVTRRLSPLGELDDYNVVIKLKEEQTLYGLYGIEKSFRNIAFFVDDKEGLKKIICNFMDTKN